MTSRRLTHRQVLVDWEQFAINKLLNLEKVMPGLVQRRVVTNKTGKRILKHDNADVLLGILKQKSVETFVDFLAALAESFPDCERHRDLVNVMSESLELIDLTGASAATRVAMQEVIAEAAPKKPEAPLPDPQQMQSESVSEDLPVLADELAATRLTSGTSVSSIEDSEVVKSKGASTSASATEVSTARDQEGAVTLDPTGRRFIEPYRSWQFTKEGGRLHCPTHGIIGHIPASAVPAGIENFEIRMKAFMQGDFTFPPDVQPCTAVVEFTLHPHFVFVEDITIKLPHCVDIDSEVDPEAFCLLRASDECAPKFEFTEVVKAEDSDGFHVVAKLRHFSRCVGARKRRHRSRSRNAGSISKSSPNSVKMIKQRKHPNVIKRGSSTSLCSSLSSTGQSSCELDLGQEMGSPTLSQRLPRQEAFDHDMGRNILVRQQSSSEDSVVGSCACLELCIVQCVPHRYPEGWETSFLLSCAHPTGIYVSQSRLDKFYGSYIYNNCMLHFPDWWQGIYVIPNVCTAVKFGMHP